MLDALKSFRPDVGDLDGAMALSAFAKSLVAEYQAVNLPVPEWLSAKVAVIAESIASARRDLIAKQIREARQQLATLETATEKRDRVQRQLEALLALQ